MPAFLLLLFSCKSVDPAPAELDALTHFFFLEFDSADDERLMEGVDNLLALYGGEEQTGSITDITAAEKEAVGLSGELTNDWLRGVYEMSPRPGCSGEDHARIYAFDDQQSLFNNQYEDYSRSWQTDAQCYWDGTCAEGQWTATIQDSIMFVSARYDYVVQMRDLSAREVILTRAWLSEPAAIGDGDDSATFFDQSYSVEVFAPAGGEWIHLYALWNSGGLEGTDPEAEIWERQYLDGVEDWNDRLDELCTDERALWESSSG